MAQSETINIYSGTNEHPELSNFAIRPFYATVGLSARELGYGDSDKEMFLSFDSVEQAYQFAKTLHSTASAEILEPIRAEILETTAGWKLRKLGRSVPLDRDVWDEKAPEYMEKFIRASFQQNVEAFKTLLDTGDATLTHEQDTSRWKVLFPEILMKVRGEFREALAQRNAAPQPQVAPAAPAPAVVRENHRDLDIKARDYDIITLGTGRHTQEEFLSLIPAGTTMIVDTRNYRKNTHYPHFSDRNLVPTLATQGYKYEWIKGLSGKTKDQSLALAGNPKAVDWEALSQTDDFQTSLDRLKAFVAAGERVVVISGDGDPRYGNRALLIGQKLDAEGLNVGHIGPRGLQSNRDVIEAALGHVSIDGGSYINVHFNSDRSFVVDPGVTLSRKSIEIPVEERLINGNWNYDNAVDIRDLKDDEVPEGLSAGSFKASYIANARHADITLAISIGSTDKALKVARSAASGKLVNINVHDSRQKVYVNDNGDIISPDEVQNGNDNAEQLRFLTVKELLQDEAYMDKTAKRLYDNIVKNVTVRSLANPDLNLDPAHLSLNIVGSHIARAANENIITADAEDLTGADLSVIAEGGLHPETTEVTQEDINGFLKGIIERVQTYVPAEEFNEGETPIIGFREIRTNGQTGVAEAATLAAQSLGIKASIVAPKGYGMILDDETTQGLFYKDEAMFKNRFHMGLHNDVTLEQLQEQEFARSAERREDEELERPGLTSTQILVLQRLGFTNTDLVDMAEYADQMDVIIRDDNDMMQFILDCAAQGIPGAEYITTDLIAQKRGEVNDLVFHANEKGIGFITLNDADYPENLRQFSDIERTEYEDRVIMDEIPEERAIEIMDNITVDGVIHTDLIPREMLESEEIAVERIPHTVRERRPAILWYQGDRSLLNTPSASLHGNFTTIEQTIGAAKAVGETLAKEEVTAVAPLRNGTAQVAMREAVDRGGKAIGFSADAIDGPEMDGMKEEIVKKGGLVLSEKAPGDDNTNRNDMERTRIFSTTLGYVSAFIDGFVKARPMSPFEMATYSLYGAVALAFKPFQIAEAIFRTEGNKEAAENGMETANVGELNKITDSAKNSFGVGADEVLSEKEDFREARSEKETRKEMKHPRQYPVPFVRLGNRTVYLVPDNYPDVREAVRRRAGKNARFADPKDAEKIYSEMLNKTVEYNGEEMNGFRGYKGTQPLEEEPFISTLFYVDGNIETLFKAPNSTLGLIPQKDRETGALLFKRFRDQALEMQKEMQRQVGLTDRRTFRFDSADYVVVKKNSVEVRRGDTTRAKVYIASNGEVRVMNSTILRDDLNEHGARQYPVFASCKRIKEEADVVNLLGELKDTLFDRCKAEAEALSPKSREEQEKMDREIEEGFLVPREDNITIAIANVADAQRMGLISSSATATVDKVTALGMVQREIASSMRKLKTLETDLKKTQSAYEKEIRKGVFDDSVNSKEASEMSAEEREEMKAARKEQIISLEEKIEALQASILKDKAKVAYLQSHVKDFLEAEQFAIAAAEGKGSAVEVDGLLIPIASTSKLTEKQRKAAEESLAKMQEETQEKTSVSEKIKEGAKAVATTVEKLYDQTTEERLPAKAEAKKEKKPLKANPDDVIASVSSDMSIAEVNGKKAFVDKDLNVVGELFEDIRRAKDMCAGMNERGQFKLIYPDGKEVLPVWLEGLSKAEDGVSIVKSGGLFNHLEVSTGRLLQDTWSAKAGAFRDGWSLVQASAEDTEHAGKFNYINSKGNMMTENWLDKATEFNEGKASIKRGGLEAVINVAGEVLEMLGEDKSVGMSQSK